MSTAERIRLPDDCTIGYIVEALLGVPLVRCGLFHSHLENLQQVPASELHEQVRAQGPRGSTSRCAAGARARAARRRRASRRAGKGQTGGREEVGRGPQRGHGFE